MTPSGHSPHPYVAALARGYRGLLGEGASALLAVSGGADSTALLLGTAELCDDLKLWAEVACLDHGLRPDADRDVEHVRSLCARLGLRFETRALGLQPGPGLEARARKARYAALEEIRAASGLQWIVTAHTADDQAETLLMRLSRGSSLRGAGAIRARRGRVLRPLIGVPRRLGRAYLEARAQPFADDPMNADPAFLRVRIRQDVLPALDRAMGAPVAEAFAAFAELAAEDEDFLAELALDARNRLRVAPGQLDAIGLRALAPSLRRRVIVAFLAELGIKVDRAAVGQVEEALQSGSLTMVGRGARLCAAGGVLRRVDRPRLTKPPLEAPLRPGESVHWPDPACELVLDVRPPAGSAWLPISRHALPLTVRARRPGDRVIVGRHTRKLQDVLVDARVPREERDAVPLVVDAAGRVLWVVGVAPIPGRTEGADLFLYARQSDPETRSL